MAVPFICKFLSTLPARGATLAHVHSWQLLSISIHAPREGSDGPLRGRSCRTGYFYPRSPRGERHAGGAGWPHPLEFLSTLPARGATGPRAVAAVGLYISIHAPREGSDEVAVGVGLAADLISIHAPREGSDLLVAGAGTVLAIFLSTLPARGATASVDQVGQMAGISIHAPREGSDGQRRSGRPDGWYFYPRSPRGERHDQLNKAAQALKFLSTLPARGATAGYKDGHASGLISIHAPREGSDPSIRSRPQLKAEDFYPRSPRGERLVTIELNWQIAQFLSTLPARGATRFRWIRGSRLYQFLSTLPARGATFFCWASRGVSPYFYPRSPRGERQQNPTKIQLDFAQKVQMRTSDAQNGRANFVHSV